MTYSDINNVSTYKNLSILIETINETLKERIKNKKVYNYILKRMNMQGNITYKIDKSNFEISNGNETFNIEFIPEITNTVNFLINYKCPNIQETKIIEVEDEMTRLYEDKVIIHDEDYKQHLRTIKEFKDNLLIHRIDLEREISRNIKVETVYETFIEKDIVLVRKTSSVPDIEPIIQHYAKNMNINILFVEDNNIGFLNNEINEDSLNAYLEKYPCEKETFEEILDKKFNSDRLLLIKSMKEQ